MMKKYAAILLSLSMLILLGLLLVFFFARRPLLAAYYIYEGEQMNYKAGFVLRNQKVSAEARKSVYRESCDDFAKARVYDPKSFDYNKCEYAVDSCLWVEDFQRVDEFRKMQESYKDAGGYKEADSPIYLW